MPAMSFNIDKDLEELFDKYCKENGIIKTFLLNKLLRECLQPPETYRELEKYLNCFFQIEEKSSLFFLSINLNKSIESNEQFIYKLIKLEKSYAKFEQRTNEQKPFLILIPFSSIGSINTYYLNGTDTFPIKD